MFIFPSSESVVITPASGIRFCAPGPDVMEHLTALDDDIGLLLDAAAAGVSKNARVLNNLRHNGALYGMARVDVGIPVGIKAAVAVDGGVVERIRAAGSYDPVPLENGVEFAVDERRR